VENTLLASRESWLPYPLIKRSFDLVTSIVIVTGILSWLLPLLAILIKLDSRGPVFFVQKRIGKNSLPFFCYKLRTMVINDQADAQPASVDDGRITRVGNWLRHYHLDELPQFFNVLLGSMSLVGPRPYMPVDCQTFAAIVPDAAHRNRVKPGITGMAQAKGLHGPIKSRQIIFQRYHWDVFYVNNADFRLDIRILQQTLALILTRRSA
jgi:putative colanic acid biosynthesis UDP-glucose lipid carrier transferase